MIAKFGLVLLTLIFGIFAFGAGVMAPASLKQDIELGLQTARLKLTPQSMAAPVAALSASTPSTASAPPPEAAASAPANAASAPASLSSLRITTLPSPTATYTLQAAQYPAESAAQALSKTIKAQDEISSVIALAGSGGYVVTVGEFKSEQEALSQREYLSLKLNLPKPMSPLEITPPPKAGS
jgi:septal ring-binding cell division protein DamX